MSNLNTNVFGRTIIRDALGTLLHRRQAIHWEREMYLFFRDWFHSDYTNNPDFSDIIGQLNVAHDSEIYNTKLLAARYGATKESLSGELYFVDPVNGDDENGTGTSTNPYKTLWWLPYFLPEIINHNYKVIILGDLVDNDGIDLRIKFGPNGSLNFIGQGAPNVISGPHTIATKASLRGGWEFTVAAPTFGPDAFSSRYFMRIDSGTGAGLCLPIFWNSTDTILTPVGWLPATPPIPGNDFSIVEPSVTLDTVGISIISIDDEYHSTDQSQNYGSKVNFFNLNIDLRRALRYDSLSMRRTGSIMSFVRLITDLNVYGLWLEDCNVNFYEVDDNSIDTYAQSGLANINEITFSGGKCCGLMQYDTDSEYDFYRLQMKNSGISTFCSWAGVYLRGECNFLGNACGEIESAYSNVSVFQLLNRAVSGGNAITVQGACNMRLQSWTLAIITAGNNAIATQHNQNNLSLLDGQLYNAVALPNCALNADSPVTVVASNVAAITGTLADISLNMPAAPVTGAWPAAGANVTDAFGSFVIGA